MGFRNLVDFNQALLAKQVWRLIRYPNSLVAKLLKAKYYPDRDIMDAKVQSNCSFTWRSIVWGREVIKRGLLWKIGDGREVRVFGDAWIPGFTNGKLLQSPNEIMKDMRVAELFDDSGRWEMSRLENLLQPIEIEEITKMERLSHLDSDMRYWKFDQKGEYSVKSGYLVASNYFDSPSSSSNDENTRGWKFIWSFDLPQRVRIFTWRVFRNIIPTELNLHKHHVPIFGRCGWCRKDWGSTAHELIFCDKARHLWMGFDFWNILKKWEGRGIWEIGGAMQKGASRQSFEE